MSPLRSHMSQSCAVQTFPQKHKFLTQPCHGDVILYKEDFYKVIFTTCLEQQFAYIFV